MRTRIVIVLGAVAAAALLVWDQLQLSQLRHLVAAQATDLAESREQTTALTAFIERQDSARQSMSRRVQELAAGRDMNADQLQRASAAAALWRADERRVILARYSEILDRAQLSPADLQKLKDLIVEREETVADARDAAHAEGFVDGSTFMKEAIGESTADLNRSILMLLGSEARRFEILIGTQPQAPYPLDVSAPSAPAQPPTTYYYEPPPSADPYTAAAAAVPAVTYSLYTPYSVWPGLPVIGGGYAVGGHSKRWASRPVFYFNASAGTPLPPRSVATIVSGPKAGLAYNHGRR